MTAFPDIDREVRVEDIRFLREQGESEGRIAERLGLAWETYSQFVLRYMKGEPR